MLDIVFTAPADPARRAILARRAQGEALAKLFAMSQPAVSKRPRVLEQAGLITPGEEGAMRPFPLAPEGLSAVGQRLALLRRALETNCARRDQLLARPASQRKENP